MSNRESINWTPVERAFLAKNTELNKNNKYSKDVENIPIVEVQNVYELGKLVVLSFLEFVKENPRGVIALPTGKTPEYFIKTLDNYKNNWNNLDVKTELKNNGLSCATDPSFPY